MHHLHETHSAVCAYGEEIHIQERVLKLPYLARTSNTQNCDLVQMMSAPTQSKKEPKEIREMQLVTRSQRLRAASRFIPESGFKMRKEFFVGKASPA